MRSDFARSGNFSFNELITTDLAAARAFYGDLLGWTFTESETIYGNPYLVIHNEGTFVGGMMLKAGNVPDDVMPCWDPYVAVEDVDASARRVEELGGQVVLPPTDIRGFGRFCVVRDPQGVSLNLIAHDGA